MRATNENLGKAGAVRTFRTRESWGLLLFVKFSWRYSLVKCAHDMDVGRTASRLFLFLRRMTRSLPILFPLFDPVLSILSPTSRKVNQFSCKEKASYAFTTSPPTKAPAKSNLEKDMKACSGASHRCIAFDTRGICWCEE